jgi:hypothetical protein
MKKIQVNPSQEFIGMKLTSKKPIEVNFRKGKKNIIECSEIECVGVNATGRRLTLTFRDLKGAELGTRRVYLEHFERMGDKFDIDVYADPSHLN